MTAWNSQMAARRCPAEFHKLENRRWLTWTMLKTFPYVRPYVENVISCKVCSFRLVEPSDVTIAVRGDARLMKMTGRRGHRNS